MCPSLVFPRNMPEWVSKRDGVPSKLPNAQGERLGLAAYERQPVGHFAIIQKGEIVK